MTLSTGYNFDAAGRLDTVSYPSGKILQVSYGSDGKPTALNYDGQVVLDQAVWTAFDAAKGWRWGATGLSSGQKQVSFAYDQDGQPAQVQDVETRNYTLDAAERLVAIDDPMDVTKSQLYGYDALNRMTSADVGAWGGPLSYGYDIGGNRTSKTDTTSGLGLAYTYGTTHNKLLTTAPTTGGVPGAATAQTYDAMGSLVNDGYGMTLGYDVTGRLVQTTRSPSSTTQAYSAMGQRVRKTTTGTGAGTHVYAYDEGGRLMGSYKIDAMAPGGFVVNEELVAFDGWRIVATVRPDSALGMNAPVIYPVLSDHLGTPRKVLDPVTGFTRWDWDAKEPFGMQAPNENPVAAGVFKLDSRFPGQRFDAETGLYHNGFRDYHAGLGRYVQSDPLGLEAGWNTYAYVGGAPMGAIDPFGLDIILDAFNYWQPPALPQNFVNSSAGFGDDITFGLTGVVRRGIGNNIVDECSDSYRNGGYAAILFMPVKGGAQRAVAQAGKYAVGSYKELTALGIKGFDAHHVGQTALMRKMIPGWSRGTAPAILVPSAGHTFSKDGLGIVSRHVGRGAPTTPRAVLARDIKELRRVYPDIPNSQLKKLIDNNRTQYPNSF